MSALRLEVAGLAEAQAAFAAAPVQLRAVWQAAAEEAAVEILDTPGVNIYPPQPRPYAPPYPYYIRGRGTQVSAARNRGESQKLGARNAAGNFSGTSWTIEADVTQFRIQISNQASYARWVIGEQQSRRMAAIGWRRVLDVAQEKAPQIAKIVERWLAYGLNKAGLEKE